MSFNQKQENPFLGANQTMSKRETLPRGEVQSDFIKPKLLMKGSTLNEKSAPETKIPSTKSVGHDFVTEGQTASNVEEKVAQLSLQLNQVIVRPYLQQALDYLKNSKHDAINAYNRLSDEVANEIRIISQNSQTISARLKEAQIVINKTQDVIRNKYNNAVEEEISSGAVNLDYEYNIVAEHYELSLQLTQEISKYKSRIDSLLSTQNLLDESMVPAVSRLQLEIDNLELLLHSFDSSDYADILAKKTGVNSGPKARNTTNEFTGRSEEMNKLAEGASLNSMGNMQSSTGVENMKRYEDPNRQRINTNQYPSQPQQGYNNQPQQGYNNQPQQGYNNQPQQGYNNQPQQGYNENHNFNEKTPMSKQEAKMIRKLREQQMKFENMMRMNEMIFEYNKSVDEMMRKQKEYEDKYASELAASNPHSNSNYSTPKNIYESDVNIESLRENVAKSKHDKLFVVRDAEPITPEVAKEISKRGTSKSIKVVK